MTAADVMNSSAALLNDVALTIFTYGVQIPFLNIAIGELQEGMQQFSVPAANKLSDPIVINIGVDNIGGTGPALPTDLLEPQGIMERVNGSSDAYTALTKQEFLVFSAVPVGTLNVWTWQEQIIKFVGSTVARQIRINYIRTVLTPVTASTDVITLFNSQTFLAFRTAALCAQFIGENKERADELNNFAINAANRFIDINSKGDRDFVRRKPFMTVFKPKSESKADEVV
jgi:hypothetical protein